MLTEKLIIYKNIMARYCFKYLIIGIYIILAILSVYSKTIGLIYAILITLLIPGFVVIDLFYNKLENIEKIAVIPFLSVILSTQLIYWLSIFIGYSKFSIIIAGLLFVPFLFFVKFKSLNSIFEFRLKYPVFLTLAVFLIFYVILSNSVWIFQEYNILLSGSNWLDTPMHMEIIESINQGNFPPQMPYFSGVEMTYHYFVDFHTAIFEKMTDIASPILIIYLNSLFASLFVLIIFLITNYITNSSKMTNSWKSGIFAGIIATFGGGFSYIRFFDDYLKNDWIKFSDLFLHNYTLEWKKFFDIVPVFETLLQSRPQMIGLSGLALAIYFLYRGYLERDSRKMILSGLITGLIFPFQVTAFLGILLIASLLIIYFIYNEKCWINGLIFFIFPILLSLPFITAIDPTTTHLSSQIGWWSPDKSPLGLTIFYIGNFGIPFIISLLYPLAQKKHIFFIYSWILAMLILPNIITVTPDQFDMYKFFNFMWIPVAIASGIILGKMYDKKLYIIIGIIIVFSIFTPFLDTLYNLSVKYPGYSKDEYRAGMYIRNNIPEGSIFLEDPSIHAPPTQIGGRLRVSGFYTWINGQGYNNSRDDDIKKAFNGTLEDTLSVINKYNASYAYIGIDEMRNYPDVNKKFDNNFSKLFSNDRAGIYIYKLKPFVGNN